MLILVIHVRNDFAPPIDYDVEIIDWFPKGFGSFSILSRTDHPCKMSRAGKGRDAMRIKITLGRLELFAVLDETPTASGLRQALPCSSRASTWGEEVYFAIPVNATLEPNATDVVEPGTVCFWVEGSSLALPYGPTPVSHADECRLVTEVNILGRIEGDPSVLSQVSSGDPVKVELA
jgi:hypothetical protein